MNSAPWGNMVDLTPTPFSVGDYRKVVTKRLQTAGFHATPTERVWVRYASEISEGFELFQREGDNLICRIQIYTFVKFDDNGRLLAAKGTWHEHGCL